MQRYDVFVRGGDFALYQKYLVKGGTWSNWIYLGTIDKPRG